MKRTIIEIDGKRYMTTKIASELWEMPVRDVSSACAIGKCKGAFKDSSRKWCIPVDCNRPLNDLEIKSFLAIIIVTKNNSTLVHNLSYSNQESDALKKTFEYLMRTNYVYHSEITDVSTYIPSAILTEKGLKLILNPNLKKDLHALEILDKWGPTVLKLVTVALGVIG